jgi:hypothetical protein
LLLLLCGEVRTECGGLDADMDVDNMDWGMDRWRWRFGVWFGLLDLCGDNDLEGRGERLDLGLAWLGGLDSVWGVRLGARGIG